MSTVPDLHSAYIKLLRGDFFGTMNQSTENESLQIALSSLRMGAVANLQKITNDLVFSSVVLTGAADSNLLLPEISLLEVAKHDVASDCWIIIYDRVYDVTRFLQVVSISAQIIGKQISSTILCWYTFLASRRTRCDAGICGS